LGEGGGLPLVALNVGNVAFEQAANKTKGAERPHISIILDRSSSMATAEHQWVGVYNEIVDSISGLANTPYVSLWLFNTQVACQIAPGPADKVPRLTTISPDGGTNMNLAVHTAIENAFLFMPDCPALFLVISDGATVANLEQEVGESVARAADMNWCVAYATTQDGAIALPKTLRIFGGSSPSDPKKQINATNFSLIGASNGSHIRSLKISILHYQDAMERAKLTKNAFMVQRYQEAIDESNQALAALGGNDLTNVASIPLFGELARKSVKRWLDGVYAGKPQTTNFFKE
jgi:hypothetical protein